MIFSISLCGFCCIFASIDSYTINVYGDIARFSPDDSTYWPFAGGYLCRAFGQCANNKKRQTSKFQTIFEWNRLEFDYDGDEARKEEDIKNEALIPEKPAPVDVDIYYEGNKPVIFVTIPRFQKGVPVTLGSVVTSERGNLIRPYPSWKWQEYPERCENDRIVSVYRVKIDSCGKIWVLDTGRLYTGQVCPMQILAFDLKTNELSHRAEIPSSVLTHHSILVTPIIEFSDESCSEPFVYIADVVGYSIIVHDANKGTFWKVSDKTMYPYPNYSSFDILGDKFDLVDGVLGMDLSPGTSLEGKKLFYHSLASVTENWVYTKSLRNESLFGEYPWVHPDVFHVYQGTRKSQSAAQAVDRNGIAYFGQLSENTLNCWNTATEYGTENIDVVENNKEIMQFPSGIKVINHPDGHQELWVLTSRLQKVITGSLDTNDVNFRILNVKIEDALAGTRCKPHRLESYRRVDDDTIVFL